MYLASVCWSLQCLISALKPPGGGGLLFRFAGSVVLRGGRGAADKCHWHVWGHPQCPATLGLPRSRRVLSPCTLLRLPAAVYGAGPALREVPVFGSSTKARTRLGLRFVPSPPEQLRPPGAWRARSPRCGAPQSLRRPSLSLRARWSGQVRLVSLLGSWPLAATLPADVNHPESQEVFADVFC